jgi:hypothetical protein
MGNTTPDGVMFQRRSYERGRNLMRDKKQRKSLKALIPQPLLPNLGEGELEPKAESLSPSPKLGRGLG